MVDITLRVHIHANFAGISSDDYQVQIKFRAPFPLNNVRYVQINEDETFEIDDNTEIHYIVDSGEYIYWNEDKELYNAELQQGRPSNQKLRPVEEIVKEYLEAGYTLYTDRNIERYRKFIDNRKD